LARAIICAVENIRDSEYVTDIEFRLAMQDNDPLRAADDYLADGLCGCICPPIPKRTASLVVIGPNLLDQSKGSMHVHAYGCADTYKAEYRFHDVDTSTPYDFANEREVVEFVYPPDEFDYDPETDLASYAADIYFYPCAVTALAAVRNAGLRVTS
jgi:hypothetical protein